MAGRREDVDLELLLQNPDVARQWVADFDWERFAFPPQYLVHGIEGKIYLNKICDKKVVSDQEALIAAFMILRGYEIPDVMKDRDYLKQINPNLYNL